MHTIEDLSKKNNITTVLEGIFKDSINSKGIFCEVIGDSMSFLLRKGDKILIRREDPQKITLFDLAVYRYKGKLITHRIIWKYKSNDRYFYIFKGDNALRLDKPVDEHNIAGKVFAVRKPRGLIKLDSFRGQVLSLFAFVYSLRKVLWHKCLELFRILYKCLTLSVAITKNWKPFNWFYRKYYILAIRIFVLFFNRFKEIETIYLRRQMASGKWSAGLSDIDLFLVINRLPKTKVKSFLRRFWRLYFRIKRFFPFLGEVEICTEDELNSWLGVCGVRQKETKSWKNLSGKEALRETEIKPSLLQFKISCLNEVFAAFWALTIKFFPMRHNKSILCTESHKLGNHIYDIIRYAEHLMANSVEIIETRDAFIERFLWQNNGGDFVQRLKEFHSLQKSNCLSVPKSLIFDIFCYLVRYLDRRCANLHKEFSALSMKSRESRYRIIIPSEKVDINDEQNRDTYRTCAQKIYGDNKNRIEAVISNTHPFTGHTFMLLKNDLELGDIRRTCKSIFDFLKGKEPFLLTRRTLDYLNFSLFLESPFTYFDAIYQGNVDAGSNVGLSLLKPTDEIFDLLLKENIANFNLCLGMFAHNRTPVYLLYHSIASVLRMRLTLEQKLVTVTLKDSITHYKKYYPEASPYLKALEERYLSLNASELNKLSASKMYYENFELMKGGLDSINENIIQQ